jgi:predicted phosphodiesterase
LAGGALWTFEEDALIADMVAAGSNGPSIVKAFQARFPGRRGPSSIIKRRYTLGIGAESVPTEPNEKIDVGEDYVRVAASKSIRDPETLFAKSGLDPKVWEIIPDSGQMKKWDVPMKIDDEAVVIPCFYVAIKVRKKWEHSDLPVPIILTVPVRKKPRPTGGAFTSVHYSDIHFPHHAPAALEILYQILDVTNPDLVVDHGDTVDCEQISDHPKDPVNRTTLKEEVRMAAEHHGTVHGLTAKADHWWLLGNHEDRIRRQMWKLAENRVAGEMLTLDPVMEAMKWENLTGVGALGWEVTPYPKFRVLNNRLLLIHGNTAAAKSGASERKEYDRYGRGGMSGHTHRVGYFGKRDWNGQHGWWGLGCMCAIRDDFVSFPDWSQGFCVTSWNKGRTEFHVERVRIFDGVGYFRGKRYEG